MLRRSALALTALLAPAVLLVPPDEPGRSGRRIRVATYNIRWLDTDVSGEGDRLVKLRRVIQGLDADIVGLQEIDDRPALELVFPPRRWWLVIDDDSGDRQDLALAVRRPLRPVGVPEDLDAGDEHFLFPAPRDDRWFPRRRDVLRCDVELPGGRRIAVLVVHAKSRYGGRRETEPRRVGAARRLVARLRQDAPLGPLVLLGDFNDSPDDRSLNVLESGEPEAPAGAEGRPGPFLVNLTEILAPLDAVTAGLNTRDLAPDGNRVLPFDPGSRARNLAGAGGPRGRVPRPDVNPGSARSRGGDRAFFDQILVSPALLPWHVPGSTRIFRGPAAVRGNRGNRASDHVPVSVDLEVPSAEGVEPAPGSPSGAPGVAARSGAAREGAPPPAPRSVAARDPASRRARPGAPPPGPRIVALFPDPEGSDRGRETVTIENPGPHPVRIDGWSLEDAAGHRLVLEGVLEGRARRVVTAEGGALPLDQDGDTVRLVDPAGRVRSAVRYARRHVREGAPLRFAVPSR